MHQSSMPVHIGQAAALESGAGQKCDCKECIDAAIAAATIAASQHAIYNSSNSGSNDNSSNNKHVASKYSPLLVKPTAPPLSLQSHIATSSLDKPATNMTNTEYCDCPSCQQQFELIKASRNNGTSTGSLIKPKVTPNRFIISPNSSFTPV